MKKNILGKKVVGDVSLGEALVTLAIGVLFAYLFTLLPEGNIFELMGKAARQN